MQAHDETGAYQASIKTTIRLGLWTFAWAATLGLAKFGPAHLWDARQSAASWAAVAVNVIVGIGWVVAFARFLAAQDELQRKIVQDALAIALGVGWVAGFAYVVTDAADLISYDVNIAVFPVFLGVVYLIAILAGMIRYR